MNVLVKSNASGCTFTAKYSKGADDLVMQLNTC